MAKRSILSEQLAQEELLFECLRQLQKKPCGQSALHVALSRLSPLNRRHSHLQLASQGLRRLTNEGKGQFFALANDDLLFLYANSEQDAVTRETSQLRALFTDDPSMLDVESAATFCHSYNVGSDFAAIFRIARGGSSPPGAESAETTTADNAVKRRLKQRQQQVRPVPLAMLPRLDATLARAEITSFLLRREVCRLLADTPPQHLFTDLAIATRALAEATVPTFDLQADPCIARYLAETLDRRILTTLLRQDSQAERGDIAIPVTLATLVSEAFRHFDDQISIMRRGSIVLKLGLTDILQDVDAARFVFRLARHRGYRILLKGITTDTLPLLSLDGLGIDFVRTQCMPSSLQAPTAARQLAATAKRLLPARIVLAGTDSPARLAFGVDAGIELFQGRYLEQAIRDARTRQRLSVVRDRGGMGGTSSH